ncbi:MAG: TlpA family protein disulfide reductase [Hydrogenophilales bacterium]|nr:TlpA family protein disulfide reductase [Hydrogenophilales bacterium]
MKWASAVLISLVLSIGAANAKELKPLSPRDAPSTLALKDLDGKPHSLADYKGRVVLVNFWATWCPPCRAEMPSMQRLKEAMKGKPFTILAVDMAESDTDVRQFLKDMKDAKLDFTILMDKDGKALKEWKVFVFPTSYVLDAEGKLRYALLGSTEWDEFDTLKKIEALLPQAVPQ